MDERSKRRVACTRTGSCVGVELGGTGVSELSRNLVALCFVPAEKWIGRHDLAP